MSENLTARVNYLLAPIAGASPAGMPLPRDFPALGALREARRGDDPSLPMGAWQHDLKRSDWAKVDHLAEYVLMTRHKDLQVAAWLGEALIHLYGLEGLVAALQLLEGLCRRFGSELRAGDPDTFEERVFGVLSWATKQFTWLLTTQIPLLDIQATEYENSLTVAHWNGLLRRIAIGEQRDYIETEQASVELERWSEHARHTPSAWLAQRRTVLAHALKSLNDLQHSADEQLKDESANFHPLFRAIEEHSALLAGFHTWPTPAPTGVSEPVLELEVQANAAAKESDADRERQRWAKIEEVTLALLAEFAFDGGRVWKGHDFRVMDSLFEQGFLWDPKGKAKSAVLTPEGLERGRQIAERLFGKG